VLLPRQPPEVDTGQDRDVEDDEPQPLPEMLRAIQRGHGAGEAVGDQLTVKDGARPQHREPVRQSPETTLERVAAEPISSLAAAVPRLDRAIGLINDESADAVDLRLAGVALGITDRAS
jgi:hypothetical protein